MCMCIYIYIYIHVYITSCNYNMREHNSSRGLRRQAVGAPGELLRAGSVSEVHK